MWNGQQWRLDEARTGLVQALQTMGQWDMARRFIGAAQDTVRSQAGFFTLSRLQDAQRRHEFNERMGPLYEFVIQDLPVMVLAGLISYGTGSVVAGAASVLRLGARAVRLTFYATEVLTFAPAQRILDQAINGRPADWSGESLIRDYLVTGGSVGAFKLLGYGWRSLSQTLLLPTLIVPNSIRGWRVGDAINNRTAAGRIPTWDTVRQRYWKNEALLNSGTYSQDNLNRMGRGLAPQQLNPRTGQIESMELHHVPPQRDGGLFNVIAVWPDEHAALDTFRRTGRPSVGFSRTWVLDPGALGLAGPSVYRWWSQNADLQNNPPR